MTRDIQAHGLSPPLGAVAWRSACKMLVGPSSPALTQPLNRSGSPVQPHGPVTGSSTRQLSNPPWTGPHGHVPGSHSRPSGLSSSGGTGSQAAFLPFLLARDTLPLITQGEGGPHLLVVVIPWVALLIVDKMGMRNRHSLSQHSVGTSASACSEATPPPSCQNP